MERSIHVDVMGRRDRHPSRPVFQVTPLLVTPPCHIDQVAKGVLQEVALTSTQAAARQETEMSFTISTTGVVPADGKIVVTLPFGYLLQAPVLQSYTNLGSTGVPSLQVSSQTLVLQLGGGNATSPQAASELEATRGVSFRVSGLVNPGAGSTEPFVIQTTFNDATSVIDEARVAGVGIATGMFPARQVTLQSFRAGQANAVDVSVTTAGLIPDNALLQLVVPNGLGLSQPLPTQVIARNREGQLFL